VGVVHGPLINEAAVKRVEGQGLIFGKLEFFLGDKEDVRREGWYIQIFRAYVAAHVAILKPKPAKNKKYNLHILFPKVF